jgi:PIN domain nuclease of toxin-antitoxin system
MNDPNRALKGALIESKIVTALRPFAEKRITLEICTEMVLAVAAALDELHADPMNRKIAAEAVRHVLYTKCR